MINILLILSAVVVVGGLVSLLLLFTWRSKLVIIFAVIFILVIPSFFIDFLNIFEIVEFIIPDVLYDSVDDIIVALVAWILSFSYLMAESVNALYHLARKLLSGDASYKHGFLFIALLIIFVIFIVIIDIAFSKFP